MKLGQVNLLGVGRLKFEAERETYPSTMGSILGQESGPLAKNRNRGPQVHNRDMRRLQFQATTIYSL
ncbi:hypothetical protein QQP08_010511 [Theobroma cacao]|nr:hypothetical protein QQP08_010511 [Theobroma cacao]